jgi:beta-N-acetylhexosaminidase
VKGGAVLVVGVEGTRLTSGERRLLARLAPFAVILLPRNLDDAGALRELVAAIRSATPDSLLALDAEGGRVDRLRRIVAPAPAAATLAACDPTFSRRAGRLVGASLRAFGFDLDFAPVVDLDHGLEGNALDRRCFGSTPRGVIARAKAFLDGLESAGVAGCVKHFPGLGGAPKDTHLEPARIERDREVAIRDLVPFAALAERAGAVMVGHAIYPELDPEERPATLSPAIATELLRKGIEFRGATFSDDLEMGALSRLGTLPELAEASLRAGCDGLPFCRRLEEAPAIARRLERAANESRLREATKRLNDYRKSRKALTEGKRPAFDVASVSKSLAELTAKAEEQAGRVPSRAGSSEAASPR